ncbi:MAG: hypothetical protein RLY97_1199 [Pseudomonadota bacterium]|jgi:NAD(P)-dependent dehydrogenase (short-subunit alcohol dehydrogenase family)
MTQRRKTIITGAAGGMGRACARLLGATQDLILTDVSAAGLGAFTDELLGDGYTVTASIAGDMGDESVLAGLVAGLDDGAGFSLIHTAGLSPSLADWRSIISVNLVATEKLLRAVEPKLCTGTAAVLIASTAGHMLPHIPDIAAILADPLAPDMLDKIAPAVEKMGAGPGGTGGVGYCLSKQAVLAMVEKRSLEWGPKGARIMSISPGMILTPMGRKEMASSEGAAKMAEQSPMRRAGTAMDIAMAAQFLTSDAASYITGSDVKVDGGSVALARSTMGG